MLDVSALARRSQVQLNSYVPAGEKAKITDNSLGDAAANNIAAQTFNLDTEGTFTQLQSFLRDLERLQPLLVVENFNVSVSQLPKLKTTMALKAIFPDLQPPATENQQQQGQQQQQQQGQQP
ncbi:MAG TPA: type II and III secretion system protein, partial [Geminocystis sp. M7585_C2015_104]|nr:type II and III secretion system protein [Geminocystis sp. M7585_C2015_104]